MSKIRLQKIGLISSSDRTTLINIEKEPIIYFHFREDDVMGWETVLGEKDSNWLRDKTTNIPRHVTWVNH